MDWGQTISVYSRLILGAAAAFLAIMLWARKRDAPWALIAAGTVTAYAETVLSVVEIFGFDIVPLAAALLPALRMVFFTAAFFIMIVRRKT
jgi:hypothetical protein